MASGTDWMNLKTKAAGSQERPRTGPVMQSPPEDMSRQREFCAHTSDSGSSFSGSSMLGGKGLPG